jgi:hypothetical protein
MSQSNGRAVPALPSYTCSSGYTVDVRRQAPGTYALLYAAAERDLVDTRPAVPTQRLKMGPDQEQDIPNPSDPAYQRALTHWQTQVRMRAGEKVRRLLTDYAVVAEVDTEAVANLRAVLGAIGGDLTDETDKDIWLWRIVAPTNQDQLGLIAFAIGEDAPSGEAIQAQKSMFRRDVSGAGHLDAERAEVGDGL